MCRQNVVRTVRLLRELGFVIRPGKSQFYSSHEMKFLGLVLNSLLMQVSLPPEKGARGIQLCSKLRHEKEPLIRRVAEIMGTLVSLQPAALMGKLRYRQLENE